MTWNEKKQHFFVIKRLSLMFFEREFYYVPEILDVFYHMNAIGLTYLNAGIWQAFDVSAILKI